MGIREFIIAARSVTLHDGRRVCVPVQRREEVVRCRDCVHYDGHTGCTLLDFAMDKDIGEGFCAWGEHVTESEEES